MPPETDTLTPEVTKTPLKGPSDSIRNLLAPPVEEPKASPVIDPPAKLPTSGNDQQKAVETNPPAKVEPKAEVKATEIKPTVADPELDEFEKSLTPKSKNRFNELATKRAESLAAERAKVLAEELVQKRLAEAKPDPEITAKLEAAIKERDEIVQEFRKFGVEKSPEFKAKFIERPKAIKDELGGILEASGVDRDAFLAHLDKRNDKASRAKLNEMIAEIGPLDMAQAASLIQEYTKIDKDREAVQGNPELAVKVLQDEQNAKVKAYVEKLGKDRSEALQRQIPALKNDASLLFEGEQGEAFERDYVAKLTDLDKVDLEALPPATRSQMLGSALLAKPLIAKVNALTEENAKLRKEVDSYQQRGLSVNGRSPSQATESKDESPLSAAEDILGFRPGSMPRDKRKVR